MAPKDLFQRHPVFLHFLVEKGSVNPQKHRCLGFVTVLKGEGVAQGIPLRHHMLEILVGCSNQPEVDRDD